MQLIGLYHHSSKHKELNASKRRRNFEDTTKIYEHLKPRNPFLVEKTNLISLSTSIASQTGSDDINYDKAEEIIILFNKLRRLVSQFKDRSTTPHFLIALLDGRM